jgi:hypothetical protein
MGLEDYQRDVVGEFVRYSSPVDVEGGDGAYDLTIVGTDRNVRELCADDRFAVTVSPGRSLTDDFRQPPEEWVDELTRDLGLSEHVTKGEPDELAAWAGPPKVVASAANTTWVMLRPREPTLRALPTFQSKGETPFGGTFIITPWDPFTAQWSRAVVMPLTGRVSLAMSITGRDGPFNIPGWPVVAGGVVPGMPSAIFVSYYMPSPFAFFSPAFEVVGTQPGLSSFSFVAEAGDYT